MQPEAENFSFRMTENQTSSFNVRDIGRKSKQGLTPKLLRIHPVDSGVGLMSIDTNSVVIGRDENCEIVIADHSASRRHARIIRKEQNVFIMDMGSTNGTWVNEERVQIQQLNSGDSIRVGRWTYKFFHGDNIEAQYHDSVYQMMTKDVLTGAWNKRYLMDMLDRKLNEHLRLKQHLSVMLIDFDFFKEINDSYGHIVGDEVLAEFGSRIREVIRGGEVFARFGGDEFAVVLLNADFDAASRAATRIREAVVSRRFRTSRGAIDCSISGGVASWDPDSPISRNELFENADRMLYKAKEARDSKIDGDQS